MNVENAKKLKLPNVNSIQAEQIIDKLQKAREQRSRERNGVDGEIESQEVEMLVSQTAEHSRSPARNDPVSSIPPPNREPNSKCASFYRKLKRICCFRTHRQVLPDATITVENNT